MFDSLPHEAWIIWWTVVGLFVGSFLNVAIHRLPLEDETISKPRRSRCPKCKTTLTWKENIPLFSWLFQRGRCRTCAWSIPWRYPLVEALTALLWLLVAWRTTPEQFGLTLVQVIVLSGLLVATFVDLACFEIPDEISIGGILLAPIAVLCVPALHIDSGLAELVSGTAGTADHAAAVTRMGSLTTCFAGIVVGGGILWLIGKVGSRLYGRDAMGFGDVKLLAAGGGFVGPGGALAVLMIASVLASVVGLLNMLRFFVLLRLRARERGRHGGLGRSAQIARIAGRYLPFGPYLAVGIGIVMLDWHGVQALLPWSGMLRH